MLLKKIGHYVLRGRREAIAIALICTLIPYLGWVASIIMSLVTLRKGWYEGFIILIWISLPGIAIAFAFDQTGLLIGSVLANGLAAWIITVILARTISWGLVVEATMIIGICAVLLAHMLVPDLANWWLLHLSPGLGEINKMMGVQLPQQNFNEVLVWMARFMTGSLITIVLLGVLFNLLIARWWQASLFNPGGLGKELYGLRLSKITNGILILVGIAVLANVPISWDLLPVVLLPFVLAGLSLVHSLAKPSHLYILWMFLFYGLMVVFFVYVIVLLVALATVDSFINFRKRYSLLT